MSLARRRARLAVLLLLLVGIVVLLTRGGGHTADASFASSAPPLPALPHSSAAAAPAGASPAVAPLPAGRHVRASMIGDSVANAITESTDAQRILNSGGLQTTLDLHACRRLVETSCTFQGVSPTTALAAVRQHARAHDLGSVLVVDVGYNDESTGYEASIDRIVRAARAAGVKRVVWVTLREAGPAPETYAASNAAIRRADRRWHTLTVADWDRYAAGKSWMGGDGIHLGPEAATELARFLRPYIAGTT